MSASFKIAKKKYSQQELRRIMSETKAAKQQQQSDATAKRIESPLANTYNDAGQLMCILCRSVVRSEAVWKVHINSKQHKESVESAKKLRETPVAKDASTERLVNEPVLKRPGDNINSKDSVPMKKLKGILKNNKQQTVVQNAALPDNFFDEISSDTATTTSSIRKDLVNIKLPEKQREQKAELMELDHTDTDLTAGALPVEDEKLPEGFFDDPKMDAKARNQEYKDPNDEEWEKFQKEIKEATNVSMAIISEEQEESTAERQISEIDEQIRNWSRVLDLEKKKEQVKIMKGATGAKNGGNVLHRNNRATHTDSDDDREDDDEDEFNEFLDWRAKKSYK